MFSHLGLSLLDHSEESDPMTSVDPPTVILAQIFYVAFLILGVVLLINMLIALLSNTYQKTEVRTWLFVLKLTNIYYIFATCNNKQRNIITFFYIYELALFASITSAKFKRTFISKGGIEGQLLYTYIYLGLWKSG